MDVVGDVLGGAAQWRCIHEECHRKNGCAIYFADYTHYQQGWVKFFKAFPCGDHCYHWQPKEQE